MDARSRLAVAGLATAGLFLAVQVGALALVDPFLDAGYQAVEDPSDPTNSLAYLVAILVMTGIMLAIVKLGVERLLRVAVVGMSGVLSLYVFSVLVPPVLLVGGVHALAWGLAAGTAIALYAYPEWYVIDAAGVIIGAAGAGLFGISFGPLPAILLLSVLAVYDALAVYRTKHMLTLAESVTGLKLPLVLVVPLSRSYSFIADEPATAGAGGGDDGVSDGDDGASNGSDPSEGGSGDGVPEGERDDGPPEDDGLDRDAFFVGLGDAVMPGVMVASAAFFSTAAAIPIPGIALNLPALAAMVGTMAGLSVLLWMVAKGRAHAGLPLLNGGAIGGYLAGALLAGVPLVEAVGLAPYL